MDDVVKLAQMGPLTVLSVTSLLLVILLLLLFRMLPRLIGALNNHAASMGTLAQSVDRFNADDAARHRNDEKASVERHDAQMDRLDVLERKVDAARCTGRPAAPQ
jgi:hypothetical protein